MNNDDRPTIIAGDFNMKFTWWNSTRTCTQGWRLYDDSITYDYNVIGPDQPTHYSHSSSDVLDITIY